MPFRLSEGFAGTLNFWIVRETCMRRAVGDEGTGKIELGEGAMEGHNLTQGAQRRPH